MRILLAVCLLLALEAACALPVDTGSVATGVTAASTVAASTTSCMDVRGAKLLALDHELTRGGASVTALATKCSGYRISDCSDTIGKRLPACTGASCAQYEPSYPIAATDGYTLRFDVAGHHHMKCTVTATAGHASDTLTLAAYPVRE